MTTYIALLRAVNVGGTRKLLMSDLTDLCRNAGFVGVESYLASGNVVFDANQSASAVKGELESRLQNRAGRQIGVFLRTASELKAAFELSPFRNTDPRFTYVAFLDKRPSSDALEGVTGRAGEEVRLGTRELYIFYPNGMGRSKLRIPALKSGTARNMNTVAALVEIAARKLRNRSS